LEHGEYVKAADVERLVGDVVGRFDILLKYLEPYGAAGEDVDDLERTCNRSRR
jgi:hypothetical protein